MIKNAPAAVISRQTLLLLYRRFFLLCWFDALQRIAACVPARLLPHRGIARARRMVASPHAHAHSALPTYQYGTGARIAPAAAAAAGAAHADPGPTRGVPARAPPLSSRPAPAVAPRRGLSQQAEGEDEDEPEEVSAHCSFTPRHTTRTPRTPSAGWSRRGRSRVCPGGPAHSGPGGTLASRMPSRDERLAHDVRFHAKARTAAPAKPSARSLAAAADGDLRRAVPKRAVALIRRTPPPAQNQHCYFCI